MGWRWWAVGMGGQRNLRGGWDGGEVGGTSLLMCGRVSITDQSWRRNEAYVSANAANELTDFEVPDRPIIAGRPTREAVSFRGPGDIAPLASESIVQCTVRDTVSQGRPTTSAATARVSRRSWQRRQFLEGH